jgi:hypothetical protein
MQPQFRMSAHQPWQRLMKALESMLVVAVLGLGTFVGSEVLSSTSSVIGQPVATDSDEGTLTRKLTRARPSSPEFVAESGVAAPSRLAPSEMRRRVAESAEGTYIEQMLVARDSAMTRWPDRTTRPLRVWVQRPALEGWNEEFYAAVQTAFDTWTDVGIPVHVSFVVDSASADVRVRFRDKFASGISGKTVWSRDARWWLLNGEIELALAHPAGGYVDAQQMRAIALHEVGHLLGLDHTESTDHIMAPKVRVRDLSDGDRATVRLLYSMPAGSLRDRPTAARTTASR